MAPQTRAAKRLETKETTTEMAPQPGGAGNEKGRKRKTTKETTTTMTPQTRGRGKEKGRKRQKNKKTTTAMAPQTRGGGGKGKAKTTKKTTTTFRNARDWTSDEEEQSSDAFCFPERKTVMGSISKLKKESKTDSKRVLKCLVAYLEEMGMPAEKTYEQAIQRLFEGGLNPSVKEQISDEIGKYIAWRLNKAAKIFNELFFIREWDSEILKLIIEVITDLKKDLLLPVPELEEISSLASDVLKADEKWKDVMAMGVKDHMRMWLFNTVIVDEIMEKWAKNPTQKIESGFTCGRTFREYCEAPSG